MVNRTKLIQLGLVLLVIVAYLGVLFRNLSEGKRRSLQINEAPLTGDHANIAIRVVQVSTNTSQMTARVTVSLEGSIAKDLVTPAVDLKLLLNEIQGPQEIDFPRGHRINPIEAVFSLDGNVNGYPFDRYETAIWMMVTKKARARPPSRPSTALEEKEVLPPEQAIGGFVVSTPDESAPVPIVSSLTASIPGVKFQGQGVESSNKGMEGFKLVVKRADNVIVVSIIIMVLMMSLAMSVLMMSLQALEPGGKIELLPLSLCVSLLFGLPALRNAQPSVPPLGAFGDYLSFLWAEQLVAISAVIIIWTWLMRQRHNKKDASE